jgi:hypothetical protein
VITTIELIKQQELTLYDLPKGLQLINHKTLMNMQYLDVPVEPVVLSCKPQSCLTLLVVKPPVKKSFSFNHARSYKHIWQEMSLCLLKNK